jgi:hypothetical protein
MLMLIPEQLRISDNSERESIGEFCKYSEKKPLLLNQIARCRKGNGSTPFGYNNSTLHRVIKVFKPGFSISIVKC